MSRKKTGLVRQSWFIAVLVLCQSIHFSPVSIRLSDSLISANGVVLQDYKVHDPINITNDGELATVAKNGTGTVTDPYIIAGWNITGALWRGISITGTTRHFRIEKCWIWGSTWYGIYIANVTPGTTAITKNFCKKCRWGITIRDSGSSILVDNTCNDNDVGIGLTGSANSDLANNICNNNRGFPGFGIMLTDSDLSTITGNTCNDNDVAGITVFDSSSLTIANNICNNNGQNGVELFALDDNNSIIWNRLVSNGDYGVALSDESEKNFIHHNNFIENGKNTLQAFDDGTNNQWYDETVLEGNYWSDYDGIGNYFIAGSSGASDPYPSLSPFKHDETDTNSFFSNKNLFSRVGLFLVVCGSLVVLFVTRGKKSS